MTRTTRLRPAGLALLLAPLLALGLGVSPGQAAPVAVVAPAGAETPELVVVLDSSGSMAEADAGGGQTRMDAAKQAVVALAEQAPDPARIGLRTYGDGVDSEAPGSCEDTTLKVPVGPVDRAAITAQVQALAPRGDTPIGISLRAAAGDLTGAGPRSIVLVSDGEPTCDLDPCVVAGELAAQGVDLRIDVVGFRVGAEARQILQCVAEAGGGQYVDAGDAGELTRALDTSLDRGFRTYVPQGTPVVGTPTGQGAPVLEPGEYLDSVVPGVPRHYRVELAAGETLRAGATVVRADGSRRGVPGTVVLTASDAEGDYCGNELGSTGAAQGTAPLFGGLLLDTSASPDSEDCLEGTFGLEVEWQNNDGDGTLPLEIVVEVEPAVLTPPAPSAFVDRQTAYPEPARQPAPARAVTGGGSPHDAPLLTPGLHADTVRQGEAVYYRVSLDWGQQLAFRADHPAVPEGSVLDEATDSSVVSHLRVLSSYRAPVSPLTADATQQFDYVDDDGAATWTTTRPVTWSSRQECCYGELRHTSRAGEVIVEVSMADDETTELASALAIPVELSVAVLGEPQEGPEYVTTRTNADGPSTEPSPSPSSAQPQSPAPSAEPSVQDVAGIDAAATSGPWSPLVTGLLVVGGVLLAALVALVWWGATNERRSRA